MPLLAFVAYSAVPSRRLCLVKRLNWKSSSASQASIRPDSIRAPLLDGLALPTRAFGLREPIRVLGRLSRA